MNASNRSAMEFARQRWARDAERSVQQTRERPVFGLLRIGLHVSNLYMTMDPKRTTIGGVDWKGLKIRGTAPYRPVLRQVGYHDDQPTPA